MAHEVDKRLSPARRGRWARRTAFALLALLLFYWAGANVALNTDVLRPLIAKRPEKLLVEWESGYTLIPGVVHVERLRVRGQSRKMQWQCRFERGTFHVSLLRLIGRTVRVSRGRGTDFAFYFRPRLAQGEAAAPRVGAMPEIEGLSNPPVPPPEALYPPKTRKKAPWRIDVSDVRFDGAVDLWFAEVRLRGSGRVGGGVVFELRKSLEIREGHLELEAASLTLDGEKLADQLEVAVDASLSPFVPKDTRGAKLLGHFTGSLDLRHGRIPDLAALNAFLPGGQQVLVAGDGRISASVKAPDPGNAEAELDVELVGVEIDIAQRKINGDIALSTRVDHGDLAAARFELGETTLSLDHMLLPDPKRERRDERQAARQEKAERKAARTEDKRREQGKPAQIVEPDITEPGDVAEDAGWWALFKLDGGTLVAGKPLVLDTRVDLRIRDTRPLLALFFAKDKGDSGELALPAWVGMVPNVEDLEGDASIDLGPEGTIIDDVVITSQKLDVMARIKARPGQNKIGQIYVRFGVLHVGVDMTEDGKKIRLSKPKQWFIEQPEFDDSTALMPPPDPAGSDGVNPSEE